MPASTFVKKIAKTILPRRVVKMLRKPAPFDNTYPWLNYAFSRLMRGGRLNQRPPYVWGVVQGAALAGVLEIPKISVIEFGVAGGCGLVTLERIANAVAKMTNIQIDVIGFDTGLGLPKPEDYRDQPNLWFEGQLAMDRVRLQSTLNRAILHLGPVKETIPSFISSNPAPIAFVSFDLDLYSSTRDALTLFQAHYKHYLPRVISYFDDTFGYTFNDFCGERLAIREFNECNDNRKVCAIHGLRNFIESPVSDLWPDGMYFAHLFDHPLYVALDSISKPVIMDVRGNTLWRSVHSQEAP
ncbi:MAG TPA: hypothetical protein VI431_11400 [Candidatus Acidoferrum sp.]